MSEEGKGTPHRRRRIPGVAVDWSTASCLRGRLLANNPRRSVCRACVVSDGARVAARVGVHRVCACCVELEHGLSVFWDKELGAWHQDTVHQAQWIMNRAEDAGSHGGVDGSLLEKVELPGEVAFLRMECSLGAALSRL
jgi:hypothetical protein